jgi:MFS family permease
MRLSRYRDVLRQPGVGRLALFTTVGRLPFGILPFAVVLLMREESYGYGEIGAVLAASALAVGLTAAFVGRLIDRAGQTRVILVTGAITAAAIVGQVLATTGHAATPWVVAISIVQGATVPPISASMRALWSKLVPDRLVDSAYALDAIQLELIFVVGPLLTAGLASAWTPAAALLLCAALYAGAAAGFATSPASRGARVRTGSATASPDQFRHMPRTVPCAACASRSCRPRPCWWTPPRWSTTWPRWPRRCPEPGCGRT